MLIAKPTLSAFKVESDRHPIRVRRVVVVGIAVVAHIARIRGRIIPRTRQPPVAADKNLQRITYIITELSVIYHFHFVTLFIISTKSSVISLIFS